MKNNEELVSIIMPTYNDMEFIDKSIESVLNQTYQNIELLIVDDCSTDGTEKYIEKIISKDFRVKYFKNEKNSGAAVSRNLGVKFARGEFIAFIDSDDVWFRDKLEKQIIFMTNSNYHFTCTFYNKIDVLGNDLDNIIKYPKEVDYDYLLKNNCGNSTVIYNSKKLGKVFIEDIKKRNDYLMWLKVIKKSTKLYCLEEVLSSHRIRPGSISSNKFDLIKYHWKVYRDYEKLNYAKSIYLVYFWIKKSLLNKRSKK
ncbi:glycosyltransferase family A protein [Exiguobacterium sp. RIT341]|uniref:glycosyltransferase family 2 protein n=1 Tax=Exiguobacterium sp. RIT341 TaxID=1470592 RepID=UPI00044ACED6|nr:glycosyltransferase family A protein [Exiguobacterium sp. RIT341]EZP59696.1 Glycosyl transferase 2 family protein [Exiguobacterium sp. RIT341]